MSSPNEPRIHVALALGSCQQLSITHYLLPYREILFGALWAMASRPASYGSCSVPPAGDMSK